MNFRLAVFVVLAMLCGACGSDLASPQEPVVAADAPAEAAAPEADEAAAAPAGSADGASGASQLTVADVQTWVNFADAVAVVEVLSEREDPREQLDGSIAFLRFQTLRVVEVLWLSPYAQFAPPREFEVQVTGAIQLPDGQLADLRETPREVGARYVEAVGFEPGDGYWRDITGAVIPAANELALANSVSFTPAELVEALDSTPPSEWIDLSIPGPISRMQGEAGFASQHLLSSEPSRRLEDTGYQGPSTEELEARAGRPLDELTETEFEELLQEAYAAAE